MTRLLVPVGALCALLPAGCTTEDVALEGVIVPVDVPGGAASGGDLSDGIGYLFVEVLSSEGHWTIPYEGETPAFLRMRVNGDYVLWESDGELEYARISGKNIASGIGAPLPAGAYVVELIQDDDVFYSVVVSFGRHKVAVPHRLELLHWLPHQRGTLA